MTADGTPRTLQVGEAITTALDLRAFAGTLPEGGWALIELDCGCPAVMVRGEDAPHGPAVEVRPVDLSREDDPCDHDARGWLSSRGVEYPVTVLFRPDAPQPATGDPAAERAMVLRQAYNDLTGDGWGPERVDEVLARVWDAVLAAARAGEAVSPPYRPLIEANVIAESLAFVLTEGEGHHLSMGRVPGQRRSAPKCSCGWHWHPAEDGPSHLRDVLTDALGDLIGEYLHTRVPAQRGGEAVDPEALALARAAVEGPGPEGSDVVPAAEYVRLARALLAARGDAAPTEVQCGICGAPIEHYDPTGDGVAAFWAHTQCHHPADGHDSAPTEVEWGVRVDGEVIRRRDHGSKIATEAGARRAAREDWAPGVATPVQRTVSEWREVR